MMRAGPIIVQLLRKGASTPPLARGTLQHHLQLAGDKTIPCRCNSQSDTNLLFKKTKT